MEQLANARDQSSYVVKCEFTDEAGADVTPTAATWTLTDSLGEVVNARDQVTITALTATTYIALSGADLVATTNRDNNLRCVIVEATYNSSLTGGPLPIKKAFKFYIEDLPQV